MIRHSCTLTLFACAAAILVCGAPASAGPGSGSASIAPPGNVVAASQGTWSIIYTAAETTDGGVVRFTIPAGWTPPQSTSASSAGYVSVSTNEPAGNPSITVAGAEVTIDVDTLTAGNTLTLVYGDDAGGGNPGARATAASMVGTYVFGVASDPTGASPAPIAASPGLDVDPADPTVLVLSPSDTTVTAGDFAPYRLLVYDAFDNRSPVTENRTIGLFPDHGQFFLPADHGTPVSQVVIPNGQSSVRVDYRPTLVAGSPHTLNAFSTDLKSPPLGAVDDVSVVVGPLSTVQSLISATSPVTANGIDQSAVTVTSRDAYGNVRAGDTVTLGVTGSALKVDPLQPTNSNGEATGAVTNTVAEPVTVSASINAQPIGATALVQFGAGSVSGAMSIVDATSPVTANGVAASAITVTARDAEGNPVSGETVTLSVSPSANAVLGQPGGVTNASGQVTGTLSSTTTGPRVVHAMVGAIAVIDSAVVAFNAGPLASFEWTVDGNGQAGVFEEVTLRARDAQGNTVTTYTGTANLNTTSGGVGSGVVEWAAPDAQGSLTNVPGGDEATYQFAAGDNGIAILRVTDTRAESFQLIAQDGAASGTSGPILVASAAADKVLLEAGSGQSAVVNTAVATPVRVRVVDLYNNPVGGKPVTFRVVAGAGGVDVTAGGGVDSTGTTAADGRIDCDVWTLGTTAGINNNKLRMLITGGTPSIPSVDVTATGTAGPGANLVLTPLSKNVTVDAFEVVTATLTDQYGNPRAGDAVTITIKDAPDGTLGADPGHTTTQINPTTRSGNTDTSGLTTVRYLAPSTASLSDVLDASTAAVPQSAVADVVYTTTASGGTNARISFVGPATATAGQSFEFLVEAIDGNQNLDPTSTATVTLTPEALSTLEFSETDFGATVTQVTLVAGQKTVYGRGTRTGDWDIAVGGGGLGSDTEAVTVTDAGLDHYAVSTVPAAVAGVTFNVTVEARDVYENRVVGAGNTVDLTAIDDINPGPAQSTLQVGQTTLAAGIAIVPESYTKAEPIRIKATGSGAEGTSGVVDVSAGPAHRVAKVSGDAGGITAGAGQLLTAQVFDAYDNPVAGELVSFAVLSGGGGMTASPVATDAGGLASSTLNTGTAAGSNTAKATIDDESPAGLERVDYLVGTVAGAIASFTVTPSKTSAVAGESIGVTVQAFDANTNPVVLDNSTVIQLSATGSAQLGAAGGTLTAGAFATTAVDTMAESFTITAQKSGGPSVMSPSIQVSNGPAYEVVKISGDASGVGVGAPQVLEVEVRDSYTNPVPNALVAFAITSALTGSLQDAVGDPADGITTTNGSGRAQVTLTTALTAGNNTVTATINDGPPPAGERVTFTVSTVAGGIAYYTVQMSGTSVVAGNNLTVTIQAFDGNDNPVNDSATQVLLTGDPGNGLAFNTNPVTLSAGGAATTVTANLVQNYRVRASTQGNPLVTGLGPQVAVQPAAPAGTITATASENPITANGVSTTTITSGVIRDAFTNQVQSGLQVTVGASSGAIVGTTTRTIDATGRIQFDLRSSSTPGVSTVTMTSQTGSATGTIDITFAQPPAFLCETPPVPSIVVPGAMVAFHVLVRNTSTTDANLNTLTALTFTDGTRTFSTNLASTQSIAALDTMTLHFNASTLDASFTPAEYQPTVMLKGTDEYGEAINAAASLPAKSLLVTSIQITAIAPEFPVVRRGQATYVDVTVKNNGAQNATIDDIELVFDPGVGLYNVGVAPELPMLLGPGASDIASVPVTVDPSSPLGTDAIDAIAAGTVSGQPVTDNSIAPLSAPSWNVQANADLTYVAGTLAPATATRGGAYAFQMAISNNGGGVVALDSALTRLTFTDGVRTYSVAPGQPFAIAGGAVQLLTFKTRTVSAAFAPGSYDVVLNVSGTENGAPFAAVVSTAGSGNSVTIVTPANITSAPGDALNPDQVSKSSTAAFTVQLVNSGGATVVLNPGATTLSFAGGQFSAALDPAGLTTLPPGTTTLTFLSTTVNPAIATNTYFPQVQLVGTHNTLPFSQGIALTDGVVVEDAPAIAINALLPSQADFTADQSKPIKVRMVVANNGGATVSFESASIRFFDAGINRTAQFSISVPGDFAGGNLAGASVDTVLFDVSDNAGNAMTAANLTIEGELHVRDINTDDPIAANTDLGGKGTLHVETPGSIEVLAITPSQPKVTALMTKPVAVRVLVRNSGQSDVDLLLDDTNTTLAFTPMGAGWLRTVQPELLKSGGTILAGSAVDTLRFNVTQAGSITGATTIAATVKGTEVNSDRAITYTSSGIGAVAVQSPGNITVTNVVASRATITNGATVGWTVTATLQNTGQADVDLALGGAVSLAFEGAVTPPPYTPPAVLAGGGTILSGGETDQITISVAGSGVYTSTGAKSLTVSVDGTELNTGDARSGNGQTSVTVQVPPTVDYLSLSPPVVSRGASVGFNVTVQNPTVNGATVTLDRATTRLRFGSGGFDAQLTQGSPVSIAGDGGQITLQFVSTVVGPGISTGPQSDAEIEMHWTQNGAPGSVTRGIPPADLTVQVAPVLNIVSIRPGRSTVTRQQPDPWTITMVLQNSGQAGVDVDLSPATTRLVMNVLGSGANVTSEYGLVSPIALESAGNTILPGSSVDSLVFDVPSGAGITTGTIVVSGFVGGIDENSQLPVSDNTADGGTGSFELQAPGVLEIVSIAPERTTATTGQTSPYEIRMAVKNTGGADVDVTLSQPATSLTFAGTGGWSYTTAAALAGGGVTLSGGETDTVTFAVNTTGSPAGLVTIEGQVTGTEKNTQLEKFDDTFDGGTGSITLQTPAQFVIDSVTPSRLFVTQGTSVPWDVTVSVRNSGQSAASLTLPAGLTTGISDAAVATVFGPVNGLEEGGVVLAGGATGTLVLHTNATGTFSSPGLKSIGVGVAGFENNSGRALNGNGAGAITIQTPPDLTIANLDPNLITQGAGAQFFIDVSNPADAATASLDRGSTRARFASDQFSAFLDLQSPVTIAGGETKTLFFENKPVDPAIGVGSYDFNVDLAYVANGVPAGVTRTLAGGVGVQATPQLAIVGIAVSQPTATAGQTTPWTATMTIYNSGSADIDLDFASDKTKLTFLRSGGMVDNSYIVARPLGMALGDTILEPDEINTIDFRIDQTGTLTGDIIIDGRVEGRDLNLSAIVSDDTFDGGRGTITVQSPAAVAVTQTLTSQSTVTALQSSDWEVRVGLENLGSSDVTIDLGSAGVTFNGGTAGWIISQPTLLGGGNVLEGGATDELLFQIDSTGTAAVYRIDAGVPWTETNTQNTGAATTASAGFGQVTVQTPPSLRITSTTVDATNPAAVNTNQPFDVIVAVQNTGQADARDVTIDMTTPGLSAIQAVSPLPTVAGGETVQLTRPVVAASTPVPAETFMTSIASGVDVNSGQNDIVGMQVPLDSLATVAIHTPSLLDITNVRPSQASVTQGQSSAWDVIVAVQNTGGADLDLTPPATGDLQFSIGGASKIDYVVQAPTAFGSGAPAWRLAGGAADSLIYTIVSTGSESGVLTVTADAAGVDRNDPARTTDDTGATSVTVQPVAGLVIATTVPVGTFNHAGATRDTVNTDFAYEIHVTVQNTGEQVDSVLVSLAKDGNSTVQPASLIRRSIDASASHVFVFRITAPPAPSPLETFTATILPGVKSHNSGATVTPEPPIDNLHTVVAQRPADLVTTLAITAPPGAVSGVVSTNQVFTMTARVDNAGDAGLSGLIRVKLAVPPGFSIQEDTLRSAAAGAPIAWTVTAPGAPQAAQNFVCTLDSIPDDRNIAAPAAASVPLDQFAVTVSTGGQLGVPSVAVVSPAGAIDDTVSVSQALRVRAIATSPTTDTENITATIAPGGFQVVGSLTRNLGSGNGSPKQVDFDLIAPASPGPAANVFVTFNGTDKNSGDPVPSIADTVAIAVVPRTSLAVSAGITAPPDATDNTVAVGTPFTVTANVANLAGAAGTAAPGVLTISLPAGYALQGGETAAKAFTPGADVSWVVIAPSQPSGPDQIAVAISTVPNDENSGQAAVVTNGTATIAMETEGSVVAVTDVSSSLDLSSGVAPGGASDLQVLGFEIVYNATDTAVPDAEIDTIAITVVDKDGRPLSGGAVRQTLKRLTVDLGGAQPYEVVGPAANPIVVNTSNGGTDREIAPNTSVTAVVGFDLQTSPPATEFRVGLRTGGLVVRDPGSGQTVGVTDGVGRPLDGQITSKPVIVLSSKFEEYAHNYPNPFRAGAQETKIAYFLENASNVTIRIYSMTGELVWEESIPSGDSRAQAGPQEARWDGRNGSGEVVRNGVYVCVLNAGSKSTKFRIAVAK